VQVLSVIVLPTEIVPLGPSFAAYQTPDEV
jgi:hypothetical protein